MNRSTIHTIQATVALTVLAFAPFALAIPNVWINEFHYDNESTDTGEFVEVVSHKSTDLAGLQLTLYNGANGSSYDLLSLDDATHTTVGDFAFYVFNFPTNGIQQGPDGMALSIADVLIQFLSYEGIVAAIGGPADGVESEDIGVTETSSTPVGYSLQLTGIGLQYSDFTWSAAQPDSPGAVNDGQTFLKADTGRTADVPESGATMGLLAMGLLGIHHLRRRAGSPGQP